LRIGNAERSVLVALAQAAVLAEKGMFVVISSLGIIQIFDIGNKKWSPEKLASRLEQGTEVMKGVYRSGSHPTLRKVGVHLTQFVTVNFHHTTWSFQHLWRVELTASGRSAN
jgi:hypothetical protein